jgi:hypothetical protein
MYSLVKHIDGRAAAAREAVTLIAALGVAEVFYKFHSFSLECLAFLATWAALSGLAELTGRLAGWLAGLGTRL